MVVKLFCSVLHAFNHFDWLLGINLGNYIDVFYCKQINSKNIDRHQKAQKSLQRTYMKTYQEEIKELTDKVNAEGGKIKLFDCNQLARRLQTKS